MRKTWEVDSIPGHDVDLLCNELKLRRATARVLINRGIRHPDAASHFLNAGLDKMSNPGLMCDIGPAAARIVRAIRNKELIAIYGDYDVDGVTSTAILTLFIRSVGGRTDYCIPRRLTEGYGLNRDRVKDIASRGTRLMITADCGISSHAEIALAAELGMETIVLDHHQLPEVLPKCVAVMNPHRPDCKFPTKDLCSAGIAFCLITELRKQLREIGHFTEGQEPRLRDYMDLVGLGTIGDVVPMIGDNRIFVKYGLREIAKSTRPGVRALMDVAGYPMQGVNTGTVAFKLAPRINAAGRMGEAERAVRLLTTDSYPEALRIARELDEDNRRRQAIEQDIVFRAIRQIDSSEEYLNAPALVVSGQDWHQGVIGIVAARLVERYHRPVFVISDDGRSGKGSGRSIPGFHLYKALRNCDDLLTQYGGHEMAAGLSIDSDSIEDFRKAFEYFAQRELGRNPPQQVLKLDGHVTCAEIDIPWVEELLQLGPHGPGNREPTFGIADANVRNKWLVSNGRHLKLTLDDGTGSHDAIGFKLARHLDRIDGPVSVAYYPELNRFRGNVTVQLKIKDLKFGDARDTAAANPSAWEPEELDQDTAY
ncbi:MAG: Single-stranded-DNA-specific exonuclease RecJ [Myxococcota bacterium]|nr:Single-stranded-DNA-specific exonuclease RecJ [Myxococcota bacterium]